MVIQVRSMSLQNNLDSDDYDLDWLLGDSSSDEEEEIQKIMKLGKHFKN